MFFIRSAHEDDLKKVQTLLAETWRATYIPIYGEAKVEEMIAEWHSLPSLKQRLARPHSEFLVADDGRQIGGMAYAAMVEKPAKTVMLHQLYVHPNHQRQGVGRDLFAEVETCFPDADFIRLEVEPDNQAAIAFYRAQGFEEIDKTANCGGDNSGIPALILQKPLNH
ncbi:GNAT family N-acetyltransferase [Rhizobium sp. L1K21]|uniref:GNAT family N-acetyltransferase n=1 Tax=Rhizobium sp. L1K21 TaxID=2954933 RepID=UPI00209261CB|nr:GNAT family N-acetyltransferase [Rhizobium sp. L1K21]MCO6186440.1 GNAT family N-acetyltransferase [Rhizobium sp. L1K21]